MRFWDFYQEEAHRDYVRDIGPLLRKELRRVKKRIWFRFWKWPHLLRHRRIQKEIARHPKYDFRTPSEVPGMGMRF